MHELYPEMILSQINLKYNPESERGPRQNYFSCANCTDAVLLPLVCIFHLITIIICRNILILFLLLTGEDSETRDKYFAQSYCLRLLSYYNKIT